MTPESKPRYFWAKLAVELSEAKPNPLFSEDQRALIRFVRYYGCGVRVRMPCAHCGKRCSVLWTQLCSFKVLDMPKDSFVLKAAPDAKVYPPLTPVCQTHIMASEMEEVDEQGNPVAPAA